MARYEFIVTDLRDGPGMKELNDVLNEWAESGRLNVTMWEKRPYYRGAMINSALPTAMARAWPERFARKC